MKLASGFFLFIVFLISGCKKDGFITSPDAQISFSADTLFYDTVFANVGSTTQFVRIFNKNDQKLLISSIEIAGGTGSAFKINVDGNPGSGSNLEILPNDSLYVFVSVNVSASSQNLPFILQDSLRIRYNGNEKFVQLQAWGQDAIFLRKYTVTGIENWTAARPYVILDKLVVGKNARLTIGKGSRIYFHANAPLLVDGTLEVKGGSEDSLRVTFQGDRLDDPYKEFPGAWPGIYLRPESHDNIFEYAHIRNAFQGLVIDQPAANGLPKAILNETTITNCFDAGLIGQRTNIISRNLLIANCGKNMVLAFGGRYEFTHLTNAAYSNRFVTHKEPVLSITNVFEEAGIVYTADLNASFINCIFWGEDGIVKDEVSVRKEGSSLFAVNFTNSLWKVSAPPPSVSASAMITNQDPLFNLIDTDKKIYDFRLKENSPAIGKGSSAGVAFDLDGNPRKTTPDLGAFERQ